MQPWHGRPQRQTLTPDDFAMAAARLGCEPAAIRAVWEVEAAGKHFLPDGSLVRRFEPHHFPPARWPDLGFSVRAGEAPWRASLRQSSEDMLRRAAVIDADAAMWAASWGAPQIMGFNHRDAGFESVRAMVEHMAAGAAQQLEAFVALVEGWDLASALRALDWRAFARRYNGGGQVDEYARRMEAAYRRHAGHAAPVVLRVGDRGEAVRRLQRALGLPDDGAFGPATLAAVKAAQAREGLAVDGVVGARTWDALRRAADVAPPPQPTPLDGLAGTVQSITTPAAAALATVEAARHALPEHMLGWVVGGAVMLALIAATAWAVRYARAGT